MQMSVVSDTSPKSQDAGTAAANLTASSKGFWSNFKNSNFWIKLTNWEYWPFSVVYIPVFFYWAWLIVKARAVFFFSASNPSIDNGGMLGESKIKIFDLIPDQWKPKTLLYPPHIEASDLLSQLQAENISYPFILKPDIGERGSFVEKINNFGELTAYLNAIKVPFLAQEYIDYPLEMGVFYYRFPNEDFGKVSSIVIKELLTVTGDGQSTVKALILAKPRAKLQYEALKEYLGESINTILEKGEVKLLMPIGNHCRGTAFLNGNDLINQKLNKVFDNICKNIEGFYFGRIDMRCASVASLYEGKDIKIMELNGAGSEPGHIYHPGTSLWTAYKAIFFHLDVLLRISKQNHRLGIPYMTLKEGLSEIQKLRAYNKVKNG